MNIVELLQLRGLDMSARTKLVRHQDSRHELYELMTSGLIETYQACQSRRILECDYMASFFGMPRNQARFIGLYAVQGRQKVSETVLPANYSLPEDPNNYFYLLEKVEGYEDLEERIVIDWESSTRSWHQWLTDKEVVQILPAGFARPFPGYLDFVLSYYELRRIVDYPESNREWHNALGNVAGVYLILQPSTGAQYVGSASGSRGIMGRWEQYAVNGHGGNRRLQEACKDAAGAFNEFKYSILRTLPKSVTSREVIEYETFYKHKLGTRAFGLNAN